MQGLMMEHPLTLTGILERSRRFFGRKEIVSRVPGGIHRYTYADFYRRTAQLAGALQKLGVRPGDRVATLAWNTYSHLEVYFGAPCYGAVLHTLNLRLPADQIGYIARHAEDAVVFVDESLLPLFEQFRSAVPSIRQVVLMHREGKVQPPFPALDYEELLAAAPDEYDWPRLDENSAAAMCYTSGTTGNPKGALYSHRALYLHSMGLALVDAFGACESDVIFPIVPMFHANAWGLPFCATMVGAKQVMPGANLQPKALVELIERERVTIAAGVPTIWLGILGLLDREPHDVSSLRVCPCGGSAVPRSLMEALKQKYGITLCQAWGMTELSPLGSVSHLRSYMKEWPEDRQYEALGRQGTPVPGVEIRAVDEEGNEVPWDGATLGELQVRGPWVIRSYYNDPRSPESFTDGWFRTGDVVTISEDGLIQIADRTKDVVKSGGEWISSVELETTLMAHPKVLEAAVIGVAHPKWAERPLACVVPKPEHRNSLTREEVLEFLAARVAKWWLPDDVVFIEAVPKTSVGKFDKKVLRAEFRDYLVSKAQQA